MTYQAQQASGQYNGEQYYERPPPGATIVDSLDHEVERHSRPASQAQFHQHSRSNSRGPPSDPEHPGHVRWTTQALGFRPVSFKPNGSFKCLQNSGKLGSAARREEERAHHDASQYMPGYTGYVRGAQHISGRTFGETTRRALSRGYRETVCASPIPSSPQANRKVKLDTTSDTFVSNATSSRPYHIPGYTGYVPNVRAAVGKSYGTATSDELFSASTRNIGHTRSESRADPGFADTTRGRSLLDINSAPLPGGKTLYKAPDKLIPQHLSKLKFFPM